MRAPSHDRTRTLTRGRDTMGDPCSIAEVWNGHEPTSWVTEDSPTSIDRFVVIEELGAGGMGRVYLGEDRVLGRRVALKVQRRLLAGTEDEVQLRREARAMAQLSHPNVVPVFDVGLSQGRVFIAMELVDGQTLGRWLKATTRSVAQIVPIVVQAGRGLSAIHAQGLVHGDIKPSNIMVQADGRVRVVDLGLARASRYPLAREQMPSPGLDHPADAPAAHEYSTDGAVRGTPVYMAPEHLRGDGATAATDQYSLCVVLYAALYGRRPFDLKQEVAARSPAGPPRIDPRVPKAIHRVVSRGLATDPDRRWPSMGALLDALERASQRSWRRRRMRWWVVLSLVGLGSWFGLAVEPAPEPCEGAQGRLVGVWDSTRREAVLHAMESGDADTGARVVKRIDHHAQRWVEAFERACERVQPGVAAPDGDLAMGCLVRRRAELFALVDVLSARTDSSGSGALAGLERLEPAEACLADTGVGPSIRPRPRDPELAAAVDVARTTLERVEALSSVGDNADALAVLQAFEPSTAGLRYAPLRAEVALTRGRLMFWLGERERARASFERAYFSARSAGYEELVAQVSTELMLVLGAYRAEHHQAEQWARHAAVAVARGVTPGAEARYHERRGALLEQQQDLEGAMDAHRQAVEILWKSHGRDHPRLASVLFNAGVVAEGSGRYHEAIDLFARCRSVAEHGGGPDGVRFGMCMAGHGEALLKLRRFVEAEHQLRRALPIFEHAMGANSLHALITLTDIGDALAAQGATAEAERYYDRALARWAEVQDADHRYYTATIVARVRLDLQAGRIESAERQLDLARRVAQGAPAEWAVARLRLLGIEAELSIARGRHAEAEALVRQAVSEAELDPQWQRSLPEVLDYVAQAFEASGQQDRARNVRGR